MYQKQAFIFRAWFCNARGIFKSDVLWKSTKISRLWINPLCEVSSPHLYLQMHSLVFMFSKRKKMLKQRRLCAWDLGGGVGMGSNEALTWAVFKSALILTRRDVAAADSWSGSDGAQRAQVVLLGLKWGFKGRDVKGVGGRTVFWGLCLLRSCVSPAPLPL